MYAVEHPLPPPDEGEVACTRPVAANREVLQECKRRVALSRHTRGEGHWRSRAHSEWVPHSLIRDAPRQRPATRAYYKMWEIARACSFPVPGSILLLCEAPGGFIQACCDLYPEATWRATSMAGNIRFHHDIERSGLLRPVVDGDLRRVSERDAIVDATRPGVDLVTADGGADVDHEHLEEEMHDLTAACVDVALQVLNPGGTLVLKVFECCTMESMLLLHNLSVAFHGVSLIKPTSSRSTNSERYVVAVGRKSSTREAEPTKAWWQGTLRVVEFLNAQQIRALESTLVARR